MLPGLLSVYIPETDLDQVGPRLEFEKVFSFGRKKMGIVVKRSSILDVMLDALDASFHWQGAQLSPTLKRLQKLDR